MILEFVVDASFDSVSPFFAVAGERTNHDNELMKTKIDITSNSLALDNGPS